MRYFCFSIQINKKVEFHEYFLYGLIRHASSTLSPRVHVMYTNRGVPRERRGGGDSDTLTGSVIFK